MDSFHQADVLPVLDADLDAGLQVECPAGGGGRIHSLALLWMQLRM